MPCASGHKGRADVDRLCAAFRTGEQDTYAETGARHDRHRDSRRSAVFRKGGRPDKGRLFPGAGRTQKFDKGCSGLDRGTGGQRTRTNRDKEPQGGVQQSVRLLSRGDEVVLRHGPGQLYQKTDACKLRAFHHSGTQGDGTPGAERRGEDQPDGVRSFYGYPEVSAGAYKRDTGNVRSDRIARRADLFRRCE